VRWSASTPGEDDHREGEDKDLTFSLAENAKVMVLGKPVRWIS